MTDQIVRNDPAELPPELDRWNWGAFLLNWIWGIGNSTYIALLVFIPFFGFFIMPFVLGAKGSQWAWRNRRWDSVEHFKRTQRGWAIWGLAIWGVMIVVYAGLFGSIFSLLKNSEAYQLGITKLQNDPQVIEVLGTPITSGLPMGSITTSNASGSANLNFSVTGPKGSGRAFVEAIKKDGTWTLRSLKLKVDKSGETIDLLQQTKVELRYINPARLDPSRHRFAVPQGEAIRSALMLRSADRRVSKYEGFAL